MKEQEATEIEKAFEEFWRIEVISAVTGEVDTGMWGNLDKEMASDVWRYAAAPLLERIAQLTQQEIKALKCPNCDDVGYTIDIRTRCVPGCCGRPLSTGECCGNAIPEPEPYEEQVQCEFCYTEPRSIFNLRGAINTALQHKEQTK